MLILGLVGCVCVFVGLRKNKLNHCLCVNFNLNLSLKKCWMYNFDFENTTKCLSNSNFKPIKLLILDVLCIALP